MLLVTALGSLFVTASLAEGGPDDAVERGVTQLQTRWAEIHYRMPEKAQAAALASLGEEAERLLAEHPDSAELLIWAGIVRSTQAGAEGGLGALDLVKQARSLLEAALKRDPLALRGSAYTSLGALYYQVPGWPIGFGDDDKAEWHLQRALSINPDGLDSLYFWGDYLHEQGRDAEARQALEKALQATPRPGRELADIGRREEIHRLLAQLKE
jgi:tetratricopeptide (TPR) repeat protein